MTIYCHIDKETRSTADLSEIGAWRYARHPQTEIMALSFRIEIPPNSIDESGSSRFYQQWTDHTYTIRLGEFHTQSIALTVLRILAEDENVVFVAHNANFERQIWQAILVEKHGFPAVALNRWKCTMAKALANGFPAGLDECGKALKLSIQKDMAGKKAMEKLSSPRVFTKKEIKLGIHLDPDNFWWRPDQVPELYAQMYSYNRNDVAVEMEIDHKLLDLSAYEQEVWVMDQRINDRGVQVDMEAVSKAQSFKEKLSGGISDMFRLVTGFRPTQRDRVKEWLAAAGIVLINMQGPTLDAALQRTDLQPLHRQVIEWYAEANKSSLAKYDAFANGVDEFARIRELHQYHGAATGRWAGRRLQTQNMKRPDKKYPIPKVVPFLVAASFEAFEQFYDPTEALRCIIRGMIIAADMHELLVADLSQMESRLTAWCSGQADKLDIFRWQDAQGKDNKKDVYTMLASVAFQREITKDDDNERQVGKVQDLAFGYQGSIAAGVKFGKNYGVDFAPLYEPLYMKTATPQERAEAERSYAWYLENYEGKEPPVGREAGLVIDLLKQRWRKQHAATVAYWKELENAFIEAYETGAPVVCGKVVCFSHGEHMYIKLPSERILCYPYARVDAPKTERGRKKQITYRYVDIRNQWVRGSTYGGSLLENIVQAIQRDLLVEVMFRLEFSNHHIVMHVHDELVCEEKENEKDLESFILEFKKPPAWGQDIPINAAGWKGKRYGKAA